MKMQKCVIFVKKNSDEKNTPTKHSAEKAHMEKIRNFWNKITEHFVKKWTPRLYTFWELLETFY